MHKNSLEIMQKFITQYLPDEELRILDLGSRVVQEQKEPSSYRQFFTNPKWHYMGADIEV